MPKRSSRRAKSYPSVSALRRRTTRNRLRQRSVRAKWLTIIGTAVLIMAIAGTIGVVVTLAYFSRDLPSPTELTNREVAQSTKIYDRNGKLLYDIYDGEHNRTLLTFDQIPQVVKDATIAAEDKDFYKHQGFSLKGIAVALFKNIMSQSIEGGGSTITQQLVKNAILEDTSQTPVRKLKELVLAIQIERRYSKDQILQIYLNEIPYGGTAYGIEAAAHRYFNKPAKELTLPEAALLAGMVQSPTRYNPLVNPDAAYARQHYVLDQMADAGKISQEEAKEAKDQKLAFASGIDSSGIKAPHFVFYVKQLLEEQFGTKLVEQGGLKVTTTLDLDKQVIAEEEIHNQIDRLAKAHANATNAGLISVDPKTGQILAYVGSEDFNDTEHDGNVDVIQRKRQPGSSVKPFTYLEALTKGYTLGTYLGDVPTCFGGEPNYCPGNSDGKYWGPLLPRVALSNSRNIPAVKMTQLVGVDGFIEMAESLGITTFTDRDSYGVSIGLGAADAKPYDMAQAYATLANQGVRQDLTPILKVEDSAGNVLSQYAASDGKRVVDAEYVYLVSDVLSDNDARARLFGPHNLLEIGRPAAVKTGTTDMNWDAWTAGYTPSLSTVVWVGNMNHEEMNGIQGSTGATPIWHYYMQRALKGTPVEHFERPDNVIAVNIDSVSGMLPGPGSKVRSELFVKGTEPTQIDTFSKQVKVDKVNGLLANAATIATGNAEDRTCIQLKEQVGAWQSYTNAWMESQGAPYNCPTKTSELYHTAGDKPFVTITSPKNNTQVDSNKLTVKTDVASAGTIIQVTFYFDNIPVKNVTSIPYTYTFNLNSNDTGKHTIKVKAVDSNGNEGSDSISIVVGDEQAQRNHLLPTVGWLWPTANWRYNLS